MYINFFELESRPFAITPDMDFMYWSDNHKRAYDTIRKAIFRGTPVTMLTGQVGTGKTLLINSLISETEISEKFHVLLMSNMFGDSTEVLQRMLMALERKANEPAEMRAEISEGLQEIRNAGFSPLLIADEAQTLSPEGADELGKIFENQEFGNPSLLIAGQPELGRIIKSAGYERLKSQIGASVRLSDLRAEETLSYIRLRLCQAGARSDVFTPEAANLIHQKANGIPRLINKLCEALLFLSAQEGSKTIEATAAERFLHENIDPETLALQSVGDAKTAAPRDGFIIEKTQARPTKPAAEPVVQKISVSLPATTTAPPPSVTTPKARRGLTLAMLGLAAGLAAFVLPFHQTVQDYLGGPIQGILGTGKLKAEIEQLAAEKQSIEQEILAAQERLTQVRETERMHASQAQIALEESAGLREKVAEEAALEKLQQDTEKSTPLTTEEKVVINTATDELVQDSDQYNQAPSGDTPELARDQDKIEDYGSLIEAVGQEPEQEATRHFTEAVKQTDRKKMAIGFARAALGGHRRAARYLGQLYETGDGVTFSPAIADLWYEIAEGKQPEVKPTDGLSLESTAGETVTPLFSAVKNKFLDLIWDGDSTKFVVEFAAIDGQVIGRLATPLTAVRLKQPEKAASWRVRTDGTKPDGAWHAIATPGQ